MRIIYPKEFHRIQPVRLNRDGKVIGELCIWNGHIVYLTIRTENHFFRKWQGFGLDWTLLKKMSLKETHELITRAEFIIIFYDGVNEKRYYLTVPDEWWDGIKCGYAKDMGDEIQSFGEQRVLPMEKMKLLGYHPNDYKVRKRVMV